MSTAIALQKVRAPRSVVMLFTARTILKGAIILALFLSVVVSVNAIGYAKTYPGERERAIFAASLEHNTGLSILYGKARDIQTVGGYTVWRALSAATIVSTIWAMLFAAKTFRGQEEGGRWELLLTGHTTPARATLGALGGIGIGFILLYTILAATMVAMGQSPDLNFSVQSCLFFTLALIAGAAQFIALGALLSQFAPTRKKAVAYSAACFGIFYVLRALADLKDSLHWLAYISPLGWIEGLQPFIHSQPLWLLPIIGFIVFCSAGSVFLASRRDVGSSIIADKDSAKARTLLLGNPLLLDFRLSRGMLLGWIIGVSAIVGLLSSVAKSASDAIKDSPQITESLSSLSGGSSSGAAILFLAMGFFVTMLALMLMATSLIGGIRDEESKGYLDNLLVRQVSRIQWLSGRIVIAIASVVSVGVAVSIVCWLAAAAQQIDISYAKLFTAGINAAIPGIFMLGLGVFLLGTLPRIGTATLYALVAWGFLLELIGSAVTINHWILDTSILHHVTFAPATDSNWATNGILLAIAVALGVIGSIGFTKRDLQAE